MLPASPKKLPVSGCLFASVPGLPAAAPITKSNTANKYFSSVYRRHPDSFEKYCSYKHFSTLLKNRYKKKAKMIIFLYTKQNSFIYQLLFNQLAHVKEHKVTSLNFKRNIKTSNTLL